MIFYKLSFQSFPKLQFACTTCTDHYKNIVDHRQNFCEISVGHGTPILYESDSEAYTIPPGCFTVILPDMHFQARAMTTAPHYSSTAAIVGTFSFEKYDSAQIDDLPSFLNREKDSLLVPRYMELAEDYTEVERLFRLLIMQYLKETAESKLRALSLWFEILAYISDRFKRTLTDSAPARGSEYYTQKVKRFIEQHYKDKIVVSRIAESLGITPGYLSKVFHKSTGKTIPEFITLTRLYHARQLAYDKQLTFAEIAREVGICDVHYLNRLFHKFYGTSLYACRLADREISLYHDKPWDVEELREDIYKVE